MRGPGLTLGQAPAALRAAVRRTLGSRAAPASSAFQQGELTAADGSSGDFLGFSVAISGSTAVVGAYGKNSFTGAAYVFVLSGTTWSQQAELTASDGASGDQFGYSVAVSGSTAVVGAPFGGSGEAYVFTRSGASWSQQAELSASDAASEDLFGWSVAIAGSTAVVGASGHNSSTGAAYVFAQSGTTWTQQAELSASGGVPGGNFAASVALSGSTLLAGAPFDGPGNNGAAYVFAHSGTGWHQRAELTASDSASGDTFGWSVALSGTTAVVGDYGHNSGAGSAYVFVHSGSAWPQQAELTASGGASGDRFGYSVAVSGTTVIVGAPRANSFMGGAYVFVRSGTAWSQQAGLTGADTTFGDQFGYSVAASGTSALAGADSRNGSTGAAYVFALPSQQAELPPAPASFDQFGWSVAVSGTTAVVGVPNANHDAGEAFVFARSGKTWSRQAELTAGDSESFDEFGYSVAVSGTTVVVGSPFKNFNSGAAYVFVRSGTVWSQQAELTASDAAENDAFGYSVAIAGTTAVVGAYTAHSIAGAAYVFVRSGTAWSQQAELTASDAVAGDEFGTSVAIAGSTVVVGAPFKNTLTGAAYVFARSGTAWSQQAELTATDGAADNSFGVSVAVSGTTAVVGASGRNNSTGAAYVFVHAKKTWTQQAELTATDAATGDQFGISVTVSGSTVLVGAWAKNSITGAAYVFAPAGTAWPQQAKLTASDAAAGDDFGYSVSLSGSTAVVGAYGHGSGVGTAYVFVNV